MTNTEVFSTGAVRDSQTGKPDLTIIDSTWLTQVLNATIPPDHGIESSYIDLMATATRGHAANRLRDTTYLTQLTSNLLFNTVENEIVFDYNLLMRMANLMTAKAAHYGRDNWKKGIPASRSYQSLLRHIAQLGRDAYVLLEDMRVEDSTYILEDAYSAILRTPYTMYTDTGNAPLKADDDHVAAILCNLMFMWYAETYYPNL